MIEELTLDDVFFDMPPATPTARPNVTRPFFGASGGARLESISERVGGRGALPHSETSEPIELSR